jgi:hypothetical protein
MADINQLITNFYDTAIKRDFARDFNFRLTQIQPEPSLGISFTEGELVFAKSAKIPGRNISNVEAKYMGLAFNVPGVVSYPNSGQYELTFYCDKASTLRQKFERWSRYIFDDASSTGNYSVPTRSSYIQMAQLGPDFSVVQEFKLVGVSVRNIGEMEYKMAEGTGAIQSFNATIAYHYYETVRELAV